MQLILAMLALVSGDVMTIVVENDSPRVMTLKGADMPEHYDALPKAPLAPTASIRLASGKGKILVSHELSGAEAVRFHYADDTGNGCVFHVAATDHSASWKKLKPRAEPIGDGVCEARTGRTIGDFVYVVR